MNGQQESISAPYLSNEKVFTQMFGERAENLFQLQKWTFGTSQGSISIPKNALDECIIRNSKNIMINQILAFDLLLTTTGFVVSLFLVIFATLTYQGILLIIGAFILIPTIVHTIDGVTRRWKRMNITTKIN